jgi:hypothetical protein
MSGNTAKNKPYYRCSATRPDYATPSVPGHPPTYMGLFGFWRGLAPHRTTIEPSTRQFGLPA